MESPPTSSRRTSVIIVAALGLIVAYFAFGMPGMNHSASPDRMAGMEHASVTALSPSAFGAEVSAGAFVVNVHVPAGELIEGTDEAIPYDRLTGDPRLPEDRTAKILLYCETGNMSEDAAKDLLTAGYRDVSHLAGGLVAWTAAGLPTVDPR